MTFNDNVQGRAGRVGGGRGRGRGGMVAGGAGGLGLIGIVLFLLTGNASFLDGGGTAPPPQSSYSQQQKAPATAQSEACTGAQANEDIDCRMQLTAVALDNYWGEQLPAQAGIDYREPEFHSFTGSTDTACGQGTSAMGPFYCPADASVYLDTDFFQVLETQLGAQNAPLAQMYIVAHEWGHHIQNQTGYMQRADRQNAGATSDGVRLELQADCLAGMFIGEAANTVDPETGTTFLVPPTREEVQSALDAAAAVGDDHIQRLSGRMENSETWTHGSSDQRMRWFTNGYQNNSMQACDTFDAASL